MATNNQIITSIAVHENLTLSGSERLAHADINTFSIKERNRALKRYWKNADKYGIRRKFFPMEYGQLDKLFKNSEHIALIVKNISKPDKLTANWVAFSPDKPPALKEDSRCFVLPRNYYNGRIATLTIDTVSLGIKGLESMRFLGPASNFLVALIGQDAAGNYLLFLQNASLKLIEKDIPNGFEPAPGGEGAGGLKFPK